MQWEGEHPRIYAKYLPSGRTFATLDGGLGSGQTIASIVIPPGGQTIAFQQGQAVSEEEAEALPNTLGVTIILGEARGA